jgi:hypothetical protein
MRLYEIADAKAQLDLLRIIIDNTWAAIAQQAEQQKRADAERKAKAKLKPRAKKPVKGTSIRIPTPPPPPMKKPQAPLAKQQSTPQDKPNPNALNAVNPLPSTNPQLKQTPTITAIKPKLASTPQTKPIASTPIKPPIGIKMDYSVNKMGTLDKDNFGVQHA